MDYLKLKYGNSKGMPGKFKLLFQISLAGVIFLYLFNDNSLPIEWLNMRNRLSLPFVAFAKHPIIIPSWAYVVFATFVVVAMSNAVNLTDGLDGLAIGPVMINSFTYLILAYVAGLSIFGYNIAVYLDIAWVPLASELTIFCGGNYHPKTELLLENGAVEFLFHGKTSSQQTDRFDAVLNYFLSSCLGDME